MPVKEVQKRPIVDSKNHVNDNARTLYQSILFQMKGFVQTRFLGKHNPYYEKHILLNQIRQQVKNNKLSSRYLNKNGTLSAQFAQFMVKVYSYSKPLKQKINWEPLFQAEEFPLFLVNQFSTSLQKDWFQFLTSEHQLKVLIETQGIKEAKTVIQDIFNRYKFSFTKEQTHQVNAILTLGTELHTFLEFDFSYFLSLFFPKFNQNYLHDLPIANPVNINLHIHTVMDFLNYVSVINPEGHYFEFINQFGLYINQKIIAENDFNVFLGELQSFVKSNFLINVVKLNQQNFFIRPKVPLNVYKKHQLNNVIKAVSSLVQNNHILVTTKLKGQSQFSLLEGIFSPVAVTRIMKEQENLNIKVHQNIERKTYLSLIITLKHFKSDVYAINTEKVLQNIIRYATFSQKEFEDNFLDCISNIKKIFEYTESTLGSLYETIGSLDRRIVSQLEQASRTILQNFLKYSQLLIDFLITISNSGYDDLKTQIKLNVSQEDLNQLLSEIGISLNMIKKLQYYFKIGITSIYEV